MLGSNAAKTLSKNLAPIRVTLIGKSGSGKSSLVDVFVNSVFYDKYNPTLHNTLCYAIHRLKSGGDDGDDEFGFSALLEIEDSRGSDKSTNNEADRQDVSKLYDPWWPRRREDAKKVPKDEADAVDKSYIRSVKKPWSMEHAPVCRHNDDGAPVELGALGRYYCGRRMKPGNNTCGKVSLAPKELEAERVRLLDQRDKIERKGGKKMKQLLRDIDAVILRLDEPYQCQACKLLQDSLQPNGEYRALTKRRMAYVFVFDCNEQESYMEALRRIGEYQEALEKKNVTQPHPPVYLVANKIDKDPHGWRDSNIRLHMKDYCQNNSINQAYISALQYKGVKKLFRTIVQDVKLKEPLWKLDPLQKVGQEDDETKQCSLQ